MPQGRGGGGIGRSTQDGCNCGSNRWSRQFKRARGWMGERGRERGLQAVCPDRLTSHSFVFLSLPLPFVFILSLYFVVSSPFPVSRSLFSHFHLFRSSVLPCDQLFLFIQLGFLSSSVVASVFYLGATYIPPSVACEPARSAHYPFVYVLFLF